MLKDFTAVKITIASAQDILNMSHGEVTKAETINYRTFKPEPGGLMAEEIFGPTRDFECYCGKYKKIRYKGIVCDRCGVEVTHKRVRRERMGHIKLAAPIAHVWFSNGVPNRLSLILDIPQKKIETVIYYARYVVTTINEEDRKKALENLEEYKKTEVEELATELESKINENKARFEEESEDVRKANKDKSKAEMQLERLRNSEKVEAAKIKSAYKQREENIDKKFTDIKNLIEDMRLGTTLSEEEFQLLDGYAFYFYEAGMGAEAIKELLLKLDINAEIETIEAELAVSKSAMKRSRLVQRVRILKGLRKSGVNPSAIIMDILPVIPPDLRPIVQLPGGRFATYDLNDLYRRVINRNNRLRRLIALGAPEIILRNEKRMLQEAVDSLLDNNHKPGSPSLNSRGMPFKSLSDMLRGKQGRFRQNLLGKRVDYSGNAVIVAGPELRFDQCGLPKTIALELFKPFIIRELIARGYAANPARAKLVFESKSDDVWDILEDVSKDHPVLLNRAPTLHRQSILAFYPVLIEGSAIRLHPITCKGFNADFDGDQMAVHLPLSEASIEEVKKRMFAKDNILSLRDGSPLIHTKFDMAMGIYFLTKLEGNEANPVGFYSSDESAIADYYTGKISFSDPIKLLLNGEVIVTTAGRAIFNKALPSDYEFVNKSLNQSDISKISANIFDRYGRDEAIRVLDEIKTLGFQYAAKHGLSISMEEFEFGANDELKTRLENFADVENKLIEQYNEGLITLNELKWLKREQWADAADKLQSEVWSIAKQNSKNLVDLDQSGATPVSAWVKKISGVGGYVIDPTGNIVDLPIKSNFKSGLSSFEYFVSARGARKSFADVALRTADSGYLTRRLHDVAQDVVVNVEDCGTENGIFIDKSEARLQAYANRIKGRFVAEDLADSKTGEIVIKRNEYITPKIAKEIAENENITKVKVRSPLTCEKAHGMCIKCYGVDNGTGEIINIGEAVGTIASQALGEPTTQLTLKSKSDARAAKSDITQGLPRVEELLEARTPKALALLADISGTVTIVEDKKKVTIRIADKKKVHKKYEFDSAEDIAIKDGAKVKAGDLLGKKSGKDIKADFTGVASVSKNSIDLVTEKDMEVEKEADSMISLLVQDGQHVEKGTQLTIGSIDPKEMAKLRSVTDAQKYVIKEVQDVYGIQGLEADDRHLEIVARQMSRYALIQDSGDSELFLPGDYVDILDVMVENQKLGSEGKRIAKFERVIMGVTNAALRTESFLSAASFEQQVRVLTDAALIGKVDHLRGLKENVIIGRPIPVGEVLQEKISGNVRSHYGETLIDFDENAKIEEPAAIS